MSITGNSSKDINATIDQTTDGTTNRVVAKISQVAGENLVKATDLETLITTLNGKIDTLDAVIDTIKDTITNKVVTEITGVSDILTLLTSLDAPGYGDEIDVSKYGMVRVHITKNNYFDGTLTFQGLISGSAYKNIPVRNVNTGILTETILSPDPPLVISEDYLVDVRGLNKIRIQATYTTTGDVSATGRGEPWTEMQYVNIANQEPIDISLSGSNLPNTIIRGSSELMVPVGNTQTYWGQNTSVGGIINLDISNYNRKLISIKNYATTASLQFEYIEFFVGTALVKTVKNGGIYWTVAANSRLTLTATEVPDLKDIPYTHLRLLFTRIGTPDVATVDCVCAGSIKN